MKRRNVLIGLLAGGTLASYPLFKWISWNSTPDVDYLMKSKALIASLSDTILPPTDTPGATECGVDDFIIRMVTECTDRMTQNKFVEGLHDLEGYAKSESGKSFVDCSISDKKNILKHFEEKSQPWPGILGKAQARYLGDDFFVTLKKYCVAGYFTSEIGATQALRYSHIPSVYIACQPYRLGEKAWATK